MSDDFSNNTKESRYEYLQDGSMAFADYRLKGTTIYINHVEAAPQLRGKGAAGKLMAQIVDNARKENLKIIPVCGYAVSWLRRHSEHEDILA